jgi:hypothetical protein
MSVVLSLGDAQEQAKRVISIQITVPRNLWALKGCERLDTNL